MATGDRSEAARFIMITPKEFTSGRPSGGPEFSPRPLAGCRVAARRAVVVVLPPFLALVFSLHGPERREESVPRRVFSRDSSQFLRISFSPGSSLAEILRAGVGLSI